MTVLNPRLSSDTGGAVPLLYAAASPPRVRPEVRLRPVDDVSLSEWRDAVELLRVAFNGGPSWFSATPDPIDHLQWKLADFPGPTRTYFTRDGDWLLGFTATLARSWLVRGERRVASDIVDAALHPSVQGRVLVDGFRSLRREMEGWDVAEFAFGFASHPASLRNRGFQGRHDLAPPLDTYLCPIDLVRFVRNQGGKHASVHGPSRTRMQIEQERRRTSRPAIARFAKWQGLLLRERLRLRRPRGLERQSEFEIRTLACFDARVDALFEHAAAEFDFIQVRGQEFLNWRYADARAGQFTIRAAEADGELLGYLAVRTGSRTADIADLLVLPGRLDVAHSLIRDAVEYARQAGASAIRSWMIRGHPYAALLSDQRFVRTGNATKPVFHAHAGMDPADLAFLAGPDARVHLMLGDSDHV